ncbi:MAG: hypothetical protein D3910_06715 [Candidatus Electrothrix sp. ATG2]|nr:hypothetical protein [Candidatus Electrothrix sp. ATG2]
MKKSTKFPQAASCSIGVLFALGLMNAPALAGSNSTTLPNGAELKVSIDDPLTGTEFNVPVGETAIDVGVTGSQVSVWERPMQPLSM